jgi:hypothetical protein
MVGMNHVLSPNGETVVSQVIDGEAILIDLESGVYYSMDEVGATLWSLIEAQCRLEDVVSEITARYDAPRERVEADVLRVVADFVRENLVVFSESGPQARQDREAPGGQKLPYAPPELNVYRDMADLLALDPPMPGLREIPWTAPGEKPLD